MTYEPRIRVLPDLLVNKIAAGEVVERPASVIKELVENAVDAGATRIAIAIEEGGKQLIRVTDDGCGMSAEELRLAVTPHATSKIQDEADLYAIASMGFRGEALASISAISRLRIVSRPHEFNEGHEIRVVAEQVESAQAAGCPAGTTIEVRDLFFNVPARRKFLRARSTEVGHISEQITRIALPNPNVGFELTNNGRRTIHLPACASKLERIRKIQGPDLAESLLAIEREEQGVRLHAYVAPPSMSRSTAQWQYTFVNGRHIRDKFIQHAIKEAYRGLTEPNRHGVVFLFLTVNPEEVDVNVHPTKIEVRWANSNLIHSQVLSALRETFGRADLTPHVRPRTASTNEVDPTDQDRLRRETADAMRSLIPNLTSQIPGGATSQANPATMSPLTGPASPGRSSIAPPGVTPAYAPTRPPAGSGMDTWRSLYEHAPSAPPAAMTEGDTLRAPADAGTDQIRAMQMHNLFIVAETEEGITIIDQHALHERVMYEQLKSRLTAGPLESQRLLLPESVRVTPRQAALLEEHADLLHRLGVEITPFGEDAVAVQSFPALLSKLDIPAFVHDLLEQLAEQAHAPDTEHVIHALLDMMACKAAIKAGDPLSSDEISSLLAQRHLIEKSSSCPHGRPTMLRLTKADLLRQFHRT